jgi:hypothetical protein
MNIDLKTRQTKGASVTPTYNGFCLTIPASSQAEYRLAQLDNYSRLSRNKFPARPSLTMSLRARASSNSIPGTWGFGLWNDPFGLSLGFGGNPFRLPILPNAIWFFGASENNYLSFKDDKPANGFIAQTFNSRGRVTRPLLSAAFAFPFSRKTSRKHLSNAIDDDSAAISVDVTQWHSYRLEWSLKRSAFWVDDVNVLETPVNPNPPLGLVIWIDNQFAAFKPSGEISIGVLAGKEEWLEIENLEIKSPE